MIGHRTQQNIVFHFGELKQAFATPDPNYPDYLEFSAVHDPKWRVNQFPQILLPKLRDDPADVGVFLQHFNMFDDLRDEPVADLANTLLGIPVLDGLEVGNR
jgi:hypothetical protein